MLTEYEKYRKRYRVGATSLGNYILRDTCIKRFSFAILTEKAIEKLKPYAPFIEVGAGTGYWAYELQKRNIEIIPTDPIYFKYSTYKFNKKWTDVKKLSAVQAVKKYPKHTLMLIWPCYGKPWAYDALKKYKGNKLVYCGEGHGGCTADDDFHEVLEKKWEQFEEINIPQWYGIYDYLMIYKRKALVND
jgi:hypothetical protein